jgi:hypothetical protein
VPMIIQPRYKFHPLLVGKLLNTLFELFDAHGGRLSCVRRGGERFHSVPPAHFGCFLRW